MSTIALWRILLTLLQLSEINKGIEDGVYTLIDCVVLYSLSEAWLVTTSWSLRAAECQ